MFESYDITVYAKVCQRVNGILGDMNRGVLVKR